MSGNNSSTRDPDFCARCGEILILPQLAVPKIECKVCGYETPIEKIIGNKKHYTIHFTPLGHYTKLKEKRDKESIGDQGGEMDMNRECNECGNKGMLYITKQLRGADEGQTVFYSCPECKFREVENS